LRILVKKTGPAVSQQLKLTVHGFLVLKIMLWYHGNIITEESLLNKNQIGEA
jgi:hypothetical protein